MDRGIRAEDVTSGREIPPESPNLAACFYEQMLLAPMEDINVIHSTVPKGVPESYNDRVVTSVQQK